MAREDAFVASVGRSSTRQWVWGWDLVVTGQLNVIDVIVSLCVVLGEVGGEEGELFGGKLGDSPIKVLYSLFLCSRGTVREDFGINEGGEYLKLPVKPHSIHPPLCT